ncbi:hypothetical protein EXIGLDRAFT_829053 [Exidia glandulosa HHB12029]|uniref:TPR-like protein n=1 Tax=Exidia glandulosa HHB12029 TaxID=1314781 RepID=A0A165Q0Z2_EXIGL|nr:hypothetical protein EXIGLDRAFT_829053 [Exidia glandulosa HHB12029]
MTEASLASQGTWTLRQPGDIFEEARAVYAAAGNTSGIVEAMLGLSAYVPLHQAIDVCEEARLIALANHAQEEVMAEVYVYLARAHQRAGGTASARSYYQEAVAAARTLQPASPFLLSECIFHVASRDLDDSDVVSAMTGLHEAISLGEIAHHSPLLALANFRFGATLLAQGHYTEARLRLDAALPHIKAIGWANHEIAYWRYLAQLHLLAGDEPAAINAAQMAARFLQDHNESWSRGNMEVLHAHAHVLVWNSDFAGGRAALRVALQHNEDDIGNTGFRAVRYTRAQLLYKLGCLEKDAGCLEDSRNYLLVAVILHRCEGKRTHTLEALASLCQVLGDDVAQLMHQTVMLPLLRCGYLRDLAYVLLHSAEVALRGGQRGLALHRARSSVRMFTSLDCSHDLHKAMKTLSCIENLMSSIPS